MKIALAISIVILLGVAVFFFLRGNSLIAPSTFNNSVASWMFDNNTNAWQVSGSPSDCPDTLVFPSPVDVNLASGILYPGQIRGNNYKPHGGFRFDNSVTNEIEVRAIMDGYLLKASSYDDGGEIQDSIFYVNDCGLMVMHGHILTLSPKLQEVFDKLPVNQSGDSRTTFIEPRVNINKGDLLATEVGYKNFKGKKNIFVDFGLYDLRKTNGVNYDSSFRAKHPDIDEYGTHAICWLDNLEEPYKSIVKNLPGADEENGKKSDYCK